MLREYGSHSTFIVFQLLLKSLDLLPIVPSDYPRSKYAIIWTKSNVRPCEYVSQSTGCWAYIYYYSLDGCVLFTPDLDCNEAMHIKQRLVVHISLRLKKWDPHLLGRRSVSLPFFFFSSIFRSVMLSFTIFDLQSYLIYFVSLRKKNIIFL